MSDSSITIGSVDEARAYVMSLMRWASAADAAPLVGQSGFVVSCPSRGDGSLLVAIDGTVLFVPSGLHHDDILGEFSRGRRTDVSQF